MSSSSLLSLLKSIRLIKQMPDIEYRSYVSFEASKTLHWPYKARYWLQTLALFFSKYSSFFPSLEMAEEKAMQTIRRKTTQTEPRMKFDTVLAEMFFDFGREILIFLPFLSLIILGNSISEILKLIFKNQSTIFSKISFIFSQIFSKKEGSSYLSSK